MLFLVLCFSQSNKKVSGYLQTQINQTLSDYTKENNPWAIKLGFQAYFHNQTKFKPTIELTSDAYLENDKVLRFDPNDSTYGTRSNNDVRGMTNLFIGSSYQATPSVYVSIVARPSFINGHTYLGVKPSLGFYFSGNQKWTGKVSYLNVLNRTRTTNQNFVSLSFTIGFKLF